MAVEGYFIRPLNLLERTAIFIVGLSLFAPGWQTDIVAILIATPILYIHWKRFRPMNLETYGLNEKRTNQS
jgi:TRAP-type uncharacterized transport system fused permease subunit